ESELVELLDSTLDHSQRRLAERRLDEPVYVARKPFEPYSTPTPTAQNKQFGQTRAIDSNAGNAKPQTSPAPVVPHATRQTPTQTPSNAQARQVPAQTPQVALPQQSARPTEQIQGVPQPQLVRQAPAQAAQSYPPQNNPQQNYPPQSYPQQNYWQLAAQSAQYYQLQAVQPIQTIRQAPAQAPLQVQAQTPLVVQQPIQPVRQAPAQTLQRVQPQGGRYAAEFPIESTPQTEPRRVTTLFSSSAYGATDATNAIKDAARDLLAVDDVQEFSRQNARSLDEMFEDGAFLEEINEDVETEERLEAVTFDEIADECFYALNPYSSLFIEYEPTAEWTESVLEYVQDSLGSLAEPSETTRALLADFGAKIEEADALRDALIFDDKTRVKARSDAEEPTLVSRYDLEQRLELLKGFKFALQRRVFLWTACLDYFEARAAGRLIQPRDLTRRQLFELLRETSETGAFFGDSTNGKSWRASFDVDLLAEVIAKVLELETAVFEPVEEFAEAAQGAGAQNDAPTSDELAAIGKPFSKRDVVAKERARRMRFLRDRLNSVAYKLEKTPMTPEQRQLFKRPTLASWAALASSYSCDQANGRSLLYEFERYENTGGGQAGRALQQLALRMSTSHSEPCRQLGRAIDVVYDNPNVKAYVSEALINRLLPIRDPEFGVVQERILNNPVAGSRRVDTTVSIELVPDPNRLLMNLTVNGRVTTNTSSELLTAKLHNESYANYVGKKTLEWQDTGIAYSAANVAADSVTKLSAVETEIDFVPLVGGIAREVVRTSYQTKQEAIRAQTRAKVAKEARERIDLEANERFDALNARLRNNFFARMSNLGLSLRTQRSKTTDDWLLASLRLGSDYSLGCQTTEPETLDGAFADVKLHESALNAYLAQLELGGRESDPRETLDYLAEKLDRPKLREVELEDHNLSFTFAKIDPVVVRFFEDQIQLRLSFAKMKLKDQEWDDLEVVVSYRPSIGTDGQPTFTRDGVVEIYGPTNIRSLLPLRAIFSKVFPAQRSFDLKPELFQTDERFAGLGLGLCRVSRGWFAISVIKDDSAENLAKNER
ncbi:MAG: hypothetical protein J6X44_00730, partial [Thermoguttaceae bacterium]|nr:hypothetical protein [Thermoguttaceae bacterium]